MKTHAHTLTFLLLLALAPLSAQILEGTTKPIMIDLSPKPTPAPTKNSESAEAYTLESLGITKLPVYHALIVGVSEYQNAGAELPNLDMPVHDAEKLRNVLTQKYSFNPDNVTLLKSPTREEIINHLDRLTREIEEKDNLLIFYAGHGYYDKTTQFGFWLPSDAKTTSRSNWIANSTIKDYIQAIKTKHTLLITDACFGGSIFKTRSVNSILKRFNEVYKDNSRKAITSGNLTEVPDNSIFLKYLLKSLDENTDVFLSAPMLFSRIYEPILNNAPSTPQFGVVQGAGDEGGDFVFIKKD